MHFFNLFVFSRMRRRGMLHRMPPPVRPQGSVAPPTSRVNEPKEDAMKKLYVLYDATCGVCLRRPPWMGRQPTLVDLEFVSAGSPVARMLFPELASVSEELTVVSDEG